MANAVLFGPSPAVLQSVGVVAGVGLNPQPLPKNLIGVTPSGAVGLTLNVSLTTEFVGGDGLSVVLAKLNRTIPISPEAMRFWFVNSVNPFANASGPVTAFVKTKTAGSNFNENPVETS